MTRTPDYPVPALEKGLDLLEALAAAAVPQSLAELAARLDRSSSELFRMLNCLERRAWIVRDDTSGKYRLSLKLYALAHTHSPTEQLVQAARGPMQALTETSRQSCHLSVLDRGQLLVIAQQESPERVRLSIEVGGTFDPVQTASGRLLLAHLTEAERKAVLAERAQSAVAKARVPAGLPRMLSTIRRTGVSLAESETIEGVHDLAVLVGAPGSPALAALAVTRLARHHERNDDSVLLRAMRAAAKQVSSTLGLSS